MLTQAPQNDNNNKTYNKTSITLQPRTQTSIQHQQEIQNETNIGFTTSYINLQTIKSSAPWQIKFYWRI